MKLFVVGMLFVFGVSSWVQAIQITGDTPWIVMEKDYENPAIQKALRDAECDWYKVFGIPPGVFHDDTRSAWTGPVILFGSAENTKTLIDAHVPEGAEQHRLFSGQVKHNPAVAAIGADVRGTIYAIYTFSEKVLGMDPMYIFTDHVPARRTEISFTDKDEFVSKKPTFEYRGWFINDEELHDGMHRDPLAGNVISMEWMDKILETLLRCKGNMIAPESAPYSDATVYDLCQRRAVVITFHHILPTGLNMMDWPKGVPFSYVNHKDILEDAWRKSVKVLSDKEVAWIIGFRGESDGAFWNSDPAAPKDDQGRANVISAAMHKQTEIIREADPDATIVAALWNEQGAFYNNGLLKVPQDVCKMFSDDGRGYMRDKGDGSDLKPGDGIYYHVMMMMNTQNRTTEGVPPARIYSELKRYVDRGATKYAIINVSGIRPAAMSVEAITDFLWDAEPALSKAPDAAMKDYLLTWYKKEFGPELAKPLTDLRLHYYNIPYLREKMPVQGRWSGARGEHLIQYMTQEMLKKYGKPVENGEDLKSISGFDNQFNQAKEPLAETAEFFPSLWAETQSLESKIPADRKNYYQAHFTYQVAVHMYSCRMLSIVNHAFEDYLQNRDSQAFAKQLEPALAELEKIFVEAHKAEYGIWDTMFLHVRLMDMWRTRLMLKETIAKIQKQPYTSGYRGYKNGSFWGDAQAYMDLAEGVYPYFYKHSGRGLEVLESGEPLPEVIHEQAPAPKNDLIEKVKFNSKNAYEVVPGGFDRGAVLWTDRSYKVGEIPGELKGAAYIRTPMEDRASQAADLITFTMKTNGAVYVGLKDEMRTLPSWMAGWEATGLSIDASNKLMLYKKTVKAGEPVALGSILNCGISAMYPVVICVQNGAVQSKF
jgi:hypothetical protein